MRTFIAIKIDPQLPLLQLMEKLKKSWSNQSVAWVPKDQLHLTLKFLGDTTPWQVNQLNIILQETGALFPGFHLNLKGVGYFKKNGNPKVLFVKIEKAEVLHQLVAEINARAQDAGFVKDNREFNPHLTLGRIKYMKDREQFYNSLRRIPEKPIQASTINEIILYQSILKPQGAIYRPLAKTTLGKT
jgi:RNA 2',3'-cyclic 3'-phosphodiesterase